jgi:hypothetical protein
MNARRFIAQVVVTAVAFLTGVVAAGPGTGLGGGL